MPDTTIYTLAKELGMTPSMVSRAFNPDGKISKEKRKKVLEAAKKHNFSPNKFASRLSMKTVRIGILINSRFKINTDKMISGVESAYAKLKDYKIKYDICVMNPNESKPDDYRTALMRYKEYDGVIITGMSSNAYTEVINELYECNPNIVQVQAVNHNAHFLFESRHNEETASQIAAEFLHNCLKRCGRKNILMFTGDLQSDLHSSASNAFVKASEEYEMNVVECVDMKDDDEYLSGILHGIFEKYAGVIDGIYITSGFSIPLCRFLEESGENIDLVTFDTYDDIKLYVQKGIISATVSQNVPHQMETAFETLVKYIITGDKPDDVLYTDVQLALKSNIHQFE